jgi:4'-phosphopantetheinyl transferase
LSVASAAFAVLDPEEKKRAAAFRYQVDQSSYIAAHVLLRRLLSESLAHLPQCRSPDGWRFASAKYGKPELQAGQVDCDLRFNLSHTKGMAVAAIAMGLDVGVDVEAIERHVADDMAIATAYFSSAEQTFLLQIIDPALRRLAFLDIWTSKEAFIKAMGYGFSLPLDTFSVDVYRGCYVHDYLPPEAGDRSWTLKRWQQSKHLVALAVGSSTSQDAPRIAYGNATCRG